MPNDTVRPPIRVGETWVAKQQSYGQRVTGYVDGIVSSQLVNEDGAIISGEEYRESEEVFRRNLAPKRNWEDEVKALREHVRALIEAVEHAWHDTNWSGEENTVDRARAALAASGGGE